MSLFNCLLKRKNERRRDFAKLLSGVCTQPTFDDDDIENCKNCEDYEEVDEETMVITWGDLALAMRTPGVELLTLESKHILFKCLTFEQKVPQRSDTSAANTMQKLKKSVKVALSISLGNRHSKILFNSSIQESQLEILKGIFGGLTFRAPPQEPV